MNYLEERKKAGNEYYQGLIKMRKAELKIAQLDLECLEETQNYNKEQAIIKQEFYIRTIERHIEEMEMRWKKNPEIFPSILLTL